MEHPYKAQLLINLKKHYANQNWRSISYFDARRDEILFVLPEDADVRAAYNDLYNILAGLPEIDHPKERVVISFCYENGQSYCSRLINPTTQDEINLALIGYLPQRKINPEELQEI